MRILVSTPWFEPATLAGGPVRSIANMIRELAGMFDFYIFCDSKDVDGRQLVVSETDRWLEYSKDSHVFYSCKKTIKKFKVSIRDLAPDCIYIVGVFSLRFTLWPLLFSSGKRVILSPRGMLHPPALEQKWFKKKIYLAVLKPILKWRRVAFHATDAAEAEYIRSYAGVKSKVFVVPNFPGMLELMPAHKESGKLKLITVALIGPMKNHHLVLKALRQCKEEIEYIICGPVYVREYWQNCEELISQLPPNIKVNYVGSVPNEQVRYLLRDAHVFICPSKSENYGHAIVEALSAGKPVIISHNTPWHLLKEQRSGLNSDLNEASLANAISFFAAMDNTVYSDWVNGAGDYVKRHVNMDSIRKGYNNMFSSDI